MKKVVKLIFFTLLICILAVGVLFGFLAYRIKDRDVFEGFPYPYVVLPVKDQIPNYVKQKEDIQILIVGDRAALTLAKYREDLEKNLKMSYDLNLKTAEFANEHDSLRRTLAKMKSLPSLPPIIIYHGGYSEESERRFHQKDLKKVNYNIENFKIPELRQLIQSIPILSKFYYEQIDRIEITNIIKLRDNEPHYPLIESDERELNIKIFEAEFLEFAKFIEKSQSKLIVLNSPYNYYLPPTKNCPETQTELTEKMENDIIILQEKGNDKEALNKAKILIEANPNRASAHYLLAKSALKLNLIKETHQSFLNANLFDCGINKTQAFTNKIISSIAPLHHVDIVDFAGDVAGSMARGTDAFYQEALPQPTLYHEIIPYISHRVFQHLSTKKGKL